MSTASARHLGFLCAAALLAVVAMLGVVVGCGSGGGTAAPPSADPNQVLVQLRRFADFSQERAEITVYADGRAEVSRAAPDGRTAGGSTMLTPESLAGLRDGLSRLELGTSGNPPARYTFEYTLTLNGRSVHNYDRIPPPTWQPVIAQLTPSIDMFPL